VPALGYQAPLDGLRGVAVLLVMVGHASTSSPNAPLLPTFRGANAGVTIFFVLSGFLITSLLLQEAAARGSIRLDRFYARRALRLLPALALVVLVFGGLTRLLAVVPNAEPRASAAALFYAANWIRAYGLFDLGPLEHCWTLAIEEQFYLTWPLIVWALLRLRASGPAIVGLLAAAIGASVLARAVLFDGTAASAIRVNAGLDTCAYALLAGCALAVLRSDGRLARVQGRWSRVAAAAAGVWLVAWVAVLKSQASAAMNDVWSDPLVAVAAVLIVGELQRPIPAAAAWLLANRPLIAIGKISYGLYLWHFPIFIAIGAHTRLAWPWHLAAQFGAAFAAATLSYVLVEQRFLRMKRRFAVPDTAVAVT
jgi:peptidoglycan/LPS O-acetylase OafA/YrhL